MSATKFLFLTIIYVRYSKEHVKLINVIRSNIIRLIVIRFRYASNNLSTQHCLLRTLYTACHTTNTVCTLCALRIVSRRSEYDTPRYIVQSDTSKNHHSVTMGSFRRTDRPWRNFIVVSYLGRNIETSFSTNI